MLMSMYQALVASWPPWYLHYESKKHSKHRHTLTEGQRSEDSQERDRESHLGKLWFWALIILSDRSFQAGTHKDRNSTNDRSLCQIPSSSRRRQLMHEDAFTM